MNYLFDTNILLLYVRKDELSTQITEQYKPFDFPNRALLSVVSVGEIRALALKNGWGKRKIDLLNELLKEFIIADINTKTIIETYAKIDAFSQNKLKNQPLPKGKTARNMGKNDLWIAATTSILQATLMTMDYDFEHLDGQFIQLKLIRKN